MSMSLPKDQKKYRVKLPSCKHCGAIGKHYSYQCPRSPKKCKFCGGIGHGALTCSQKPRKFIKKESNKYRKKRQDTSRAWYRANPPDSNGNWVCYLQIATECPRILTRETITLEHVKPKVRYPELRFDISNLKPACSLCNKEKASRELHELPLYGSIRISEKLLGEDSD